MAITLPSAEVLLCRIRPEYERAAIFQPARRPYSGQELLSPEMEDIISCATEQTGPNHRALHLDVA